MSTPEAPFLTIIIPVLNGEKHIKNALECILNQPCRDLEVIIGEDGSTDATLEISQSFAANDPRVHVDSHPNYGVGKNLNHAMDQARGRWIVFLDVDDAIPDTFYTEDLKKFLEICLRNEIDVIVPARVHNTLGEDAAYLDFVPEHGLVGQYSAASWDIKHEYATLLYSADVIKGHDIRFHEEWVQMETVFRHCCVYAARKALFTNELFMGIRHLHSEQITATWNFFKVIPIRIDAFYQLCLWHEQQNPNDAAAIRRAWETLEDMVVDYLIDAYRTCGLGPEMDQALSIGKMPELLAHIPAQFDETHRHILEQFDKARHHFLKRSRIKSMQETLEKADADRSSWTHSYPYEAAPSIQKTMAEFQQDALGFPAVYAALCEKYALD